MSEQTERKALSKKLRFEVFKRDGFRCMYCGATPDQALLQCDHIHPVALGGQNEMDNLATACQPCNAGKSATPLSVVPTSLEDRALETLEREEQIAAYQAIMRARRERIEDDCNEVLNLFCERFRRDGIPWRDFNSIKIFVTKLGVTDALDSVDIAHARFTYSYAQAFRYFCGVCWRKIKRAEGLE